MMKTDDSRRVEFFPTAARQFFVGDCDAANLKKFPRVIPADLRPCSLLGKETEGFHIDKRAHATELTVSSLYLKKFTLPSRPRARYLQHLLSPPRV